MKQTTAWLLVSAFAASVQAAAAGDITGTVTVKGTPPPELKITMDAACGKMHTEGVTTKHYVVGPKSELANVVVMLKGITGKSTGTSAQPAILDQAGCEYTPSILAVQTGQKLLVKNSDPVLHNVHTTPVPNGGNREQNLAQMPKGPDLTFTFNAPENFLRFKCDVHAWMFAWVTVVDHPYFAVTDKDGKFTIRNVPAGKYTITALHRKAAPTGMDQEIEVKDGEPATISFALEAK